VFCLDSFVDGWRERDIGLRGYISFNILFCLNF